MPGSFRIEADHTASTIQSAGRIGHTRGKEVECVTKADIASLVAEKGLTKKQAMEAVEATLDIIKNALQAGEKIQLVGFGSFQVRSKRARKGRNPQTGSEITITARKVLKFKPGKALHQTVNVEG
jgi:DNA-binding protein HU-beta